MPRYRLVQEEYPKSTLYVVERRKWRFFWRSIYISYDPDRALDMYNNLRRPMGETEKIPQRA